MQEHVADVFSELGYYKLFEKAEKARWIVSELPWDRLDKSKVTPIILHNAKTSAFGELTTFSATQAFMHLFEDDIDFTQWLAVWFYEETKHPHVLIKWLRALGVEIDGDSVKCGREIFPMTESKTEMLTFNIISEIAASDMYHHFRQMTDEPVLVEITRNLSRDEMRHSQGFEYYCRKCIETSEDPDWERLRCLRAAWFSLETSTSGRAQHPVFRTLREMRGIDDDEMHARISDRVVKRISSMLDMNIDGHEGLYAAYVALRKTYRTNRQGEKGIALGP